MAPGSGWGIERGGRGAVREWIFKKTRAAAKAKDRFSRRQAGAGQGGKRKVGKGNRDATFAAFAPASETRHAWGSKHRDVLAMLEQGQ